MRIEYAHLSDKPPFVKLSGANRPSQEILHTALGYLQDNFDKVVQHQCIVYKEWNCKEAFCIPDFICGNDEEVVIIDAKIIPATESKMNQYKQLLEFIMWNKGDYRTVKCMHLYEALPYQPFF